MRRDEQMRVAKEFARAKGIDVEEKYRVLSVLADSTSTRILFHNDNGPPGDHFMIVLDNASMQVTRFVPGE